MNRAFLMKLEEFIKSKVDFKLMNSLGGESFSKFVSKMVIEFSKDSCPRRNYNMSQDEVRDIFLDMLADLCSARYVHPDATKCYSYETPLRQYKVVFASSKKEATDILKSLPFMSMNSFGRRASLQKVVQFTPTGVITDKGEERTLDMWKDFINLFGNGRLADE